MPIVGMVVSCVTVIVSVDVFPAVSVAVIVMSCAPSARLMTGMLQVPPLGTTVPLVVPTSPVVDQEINATEMFERYAQSGGDPAGLASLRAAYRLSPALDYAT